MSLVKHTNLRTLPVGKKFPVLFEGEFVAGEIWLTEAGEIDGTLDPVLFLAEFAGMHIVLLAEVNDITGEKRVSVDFRTEAELRAMGTFEGPDCDHPECQPGFDPSAN